MTTRSHVQLARQWRIIQELTSSKYGVTVARLLDRLGASRATLYRDLDVLLTSSLPIIKTTVAGEARYFVEGARLPSLTLSARQLGAVSLARRALAPLAGMSFLRELDDLLQLAHGKPVDEGAVALADLTTPAAPQVISILELCVGNDMKAKLLYLGTKDHEARWRNIEPVEVKLDDNQVSVFAWDTDRNDWRTFKVARIQHAIYVDENATAHPPYRPEDHFAHSMGMWSGEPVEVVVKLSGRVARIAREYPLVARQTVMPMPDGGVVVRATVAGIFEPMRWVLKWGRDAEALEPPALRQAVHDELRGAVERYGLGPDPIKVSQQR